MPLPSEIQLILGFLVDDEKLRKLAGKLTMRRQRRQLAEISPEPRQVVVGDILVAEEDHKMLQERRANFGDHGFVEIRGQVDTGNFGPHGARQGPYVDMLVTHLKFPICSDIAVPERRASMPAGPNVRLFSTVSGCLRAITACGYSAS